jgi:hypothetical protein
MKKQSRNRRKVMRYYYTRKQTPKGLLWTLKPQFEFMFEDQECYKVK